MGAAYFIVLEREIDGLDTGMDGKRLSEEMESLDEAARELGVRPLSEFFSADPDDLSEVMEDAGVDEADMNVPPLEQFPAEEGLVTIRALLTHTAGQTEDVARELRDCERILDAAAKAGVRWHFEVDF